MFRWISILAGPVLGFLAGWQLFEATGSHDMSVTAALAVWMAVWWITEAVSIYFTSFLPVVVLPMAGVISMKELAPAYLPEIIFFFIGGFLLAFALEQWNLHKKIAYRIIIAMGSSPKKILFGFMLASYLLSMWILNTAVVMMLLPALLAVIDEIAGEDPVKEKSAPYLLGLAYAASIGGTATLIGTAPNLYFADFYNESFPAEPPITFATWYLIGFPLSLVFFVITYFFLVRKFFSGDSHPKVDVEYCRNEYRKLGSFTYEQKVVGIVFLVTVVAWFTARDVTIGSFEFHGWTNWFPNGSFIKESTIAMLSALLLTVIPSKTNKGFILNWEAARRMPIGVLFLFGGGFALAKVVGSTGLSAWLGDQLTFVHSFHPLLIAITLSLFMTFFTELTSNTASTVLMLPVLLAMSVNIDAHPLVFMLPVVVSASFAFMLPVATPPNTIVFGSERLRITDMARTGFWLNIIGVVVTNIFMFTLAGYVFGF